MSSPTNNRYVGALSTLEVHLDRVRRNYLYLAKQLKKGADCAGVVKSDAYGIGAAQVVPELYKANCRHFYVSTFDEGVAVRAALAGQEAQVYVLSGPHGAAVKDFTQHGLTPVLNTLGDIEYWRGDKNPAVIQLDTGMNRLGLSAADTAGLKKETLQSIDVRYVMSHLACADEPGHPKNREQLEKFKTLTQQLGIPARFSFANSSGIFLGPDYHFDQVRPGCALYGINPQPHLQNPMQGVVTLKASILQIRAAAAGESVGYSSNYKLARASKLATISVGYADGLPRSFAGAGTVTIHGQKCPVAGRVSMETIVADVTNVSAVVREGDWAELIGDHQTVDDVAAAAKTIGYEILTALGKRYKREYSGRE